MACTGVFFLADLIIQFHVGFVATSGSMRRLLVMNGRLIAQFYVKKGTFFIDAISTAAWVGQITLVAVYRSQTVEAQTALMVLETLRLLRFLRMVRLMKNLIIGSVSLSITRDSKSLKFLQNANLMWVLGGWGWRAGSQKLILVAEAGVDALRH